MNQDNKTASSTIIPKYVSIFNDMGKSWWNDSTLQNTLYLLNDLRIPWIINGLVEYEVISKDTAKSEKPLRNLVILDAGCGGGYVAEDLARKGATVVGIDPAEDLINVAREHAANEPELSGITYVCEPIEQHWERNKLKYDIVIASQVLSYLDEPDLFLKKCVECLKPGGPIFVTTLTRNWSSWIFFKTLQYLKRYPKDLYDYQKCSTPEEIKESLKKYNCKTKNALGMRYSIFGQKWNWCLYGSSLFAIHGKKHGNN